MTPDPFMWGNSVNLVVFVRDSKVIAWYEQPRRVELGYLVNDSGYAPTEAKFRIVRNGEGAELAPIQPAKNP